MQNFCSRYRLIKPLSLTYYKNSQFSFKNNKNDIKFSDYILKHISPVKVVISLVVVSWAVLLKTWYDFEEKTRSRAQEYYDQGGNMDEKIPEEYRGEFIEKQKRKMKSSKNKENTTEVTIISKD